MQAKLICNITKGGLLPNKRCHCYERIIAGLLQNKKLVIPAKNHSGAVAK